MTNEHLLIMLAGLQAKHFVADFLLQTARMRTHKGHYGRAGGLWHVLVHVAGSALVLLAGLGPSAGLALVLLGEGFVHYHIDWAKEKIGRRRSLSMQTQCFWQLFGLDQLAHQFTYLTMIFALLT